MGALLTAARNIYSDESIARVGHTGLALHVTLNSERVPSKEPLVAAASYMQQCVGRPPTSLTKRQVWVRHGSTQHWHCMQPSAVSRVPASKGWQRPPA